MHFAYNNAPLVEVVAELHWFLTEIHQESKTKIDPYYYIFQAEFLKNAEKLGLKHTEMMIPSFVPSELTPNQPRIRLRKNPEEWPIVQIGPGILTAHMVPPYSGWNEFEKFLFNSVDKFFDSHPKARDGLQIEKLRLRYIDGFDEKFGFGRIAEFSKEMLGMNSPLPKAFIENCVKKDSEVTLLIEGRFLNHSPDGSSSTLKLTPGVVKGKEALVLETVCETIDNTEVMVDSATIIDWFKDAHANLREQFNQLTTASLKSVMGEKKEAQI